MEFCTITPTAGLEKWGTALSRRHLVLAQQLYNKEYMAYYAARKQAGDFIILDNGAYENTRPLDNAAYFNYIKALAPDVAVLPDILMSPWRETTSASLRFLDEFAPWLEEHSYRTQWMFVPQIQRAIDSPGVEPPREEFFKSLDTVVNDGRVGKYVTWVGLGRYLHTEFINITPKFRRTIIARDVQHKYPHLKIHALGMAAGNLDELKTLHQVGINSIDSSAPVWRGWQGYQLDIPEDQEKWKAKGTVCDFSAQLDSSMDEVISYNLEVIRKCLL